MTNYTYLPLDDYAQSANSLFHFMKKRDYLNDILRRKALVPRYCFETVEYLDIHNDNHRFNDVAILQKCFCDIPFHKLAAPFSVSIVNKNDAPLSNVDFSEIEKNNTHFTFYGEYAIGFSKIWAENNHLQPVHYLNDQSQYTKDFSTLLKKVMEADDIPDEFAQDVLNRLAYIKPLRGVMDRRITCGTIPSITIKICKNFHDECEWRYVPSSSVLSPLNIESIIATPGPSDITDMINARLEDQQFEVLWLHFTYDDIRYIVVPNTQARIDLITTILNLPDSCFEAIEAISMQKNILISKILVLDEIRKDW